MLGTPFDFTAPHTIGSRIAQVPHLRVCFTCASVPNDFVKHYGYAPSCRPVCTKTLALLCRQVFWAETSPLQMQTHSMWALQVQLSKLNSLHAVPSRVWAETSPLQMQTHSMWALQVQLSKINSLHASKA